MPRARYESGRRCRQKGQYSFAIISRAPFHLHVRACRTFCYVSVSLCLISIVNVVSSFAAFSVPLVSMLRCADASAVVGLGSSARFCTSEFGANGI
jgi:hypothetical protein